ncbi:MAG: M56 family metallopeptidase [Bacteroidota bacterium]
MEIAYVGPTLAEALGWTLLHSLWQGFAIFLLLSFGLHLSRSSSPNFRYRLSVGALLSLTLWVFYTFYTYYIQVSPGMSASPQEFVLNPFVVPLPSPMYEASIWDNFYQVFQQFIQFYARELVGVWLLGVALFVVRWAGSLYYTYLLRKTLTVPAMESWQQKVREISKRIGINKSVMLMESARVEVPMVIGHLKPMILFPLGMISGLSPIQVEAIIAHELAHIKRYDFLVNLFLSLVEILFFYHPVYWWISVRIADEREHACDDLAVAVTGNPRAYAEALMEMESLLQPPNLGLAIQGRKNHLLNRIKRVCLGEQEVQKSETGKIGLTLGLLLAIAFITWFRLPAQEELYWEEGMIESTWEEWSSGEPAEFGEGFFPELAEVPGPEGPFELEAFPIEAEFFELAELDSPVIIPPLPPIPPMPEIQSLPPIPPIPELPELVPSADPEVYSEALEAFQQHYQDWEMEYQEMYQEWQQVYQERYQEWQTHIQEIYQEYEEQAREIYERNAEALHSDGELERARELEQRTLERQLHQQERELQRSQQLLERELQSEMMQQQYRLAQVQARLQKELQQMNNRIRLRMGNSMQGTHWAPKPDPAPSPDARPLLEGSSDCEERFREALREDGFNREAEEKKLELELYENQGKKGLKINGKPYASVLAERWIKVLEDCGLDMNKIQRMGFREHRVAPNEIWASYDDPSIDSSFFAFHKVMTSQLFKDGLIPSFTKKWRLTQSKGKIIINGKRIPEELLPTYERILESYGKSAEFSRIKYRQSADPRDRAEVSPTPLAQPEPFPSPVGESRAPRETGPFPHLVNSGAPNRSLSPNEPVEISGFGEAYPISGQTSSEQDIRDLLTEERIISHGKAPFSLVIKGKIVKTVNETVLSEELGEKLWKMLEEGGTSFEGDWTLKYKAVD